MALCDLINSINDHITELQHRKWREYPLVTFKSQLYIALCYLLFVKVLGPQLMKNRPAFTLRKTLIVYNFSQVIVNLYLFIEIGRRSYFGRYSFWCQPEEAPDSPFLDDYFKFGWILFMDKWSDCLDTIFFVLRKKNNQISGLHLFHHGAMPLIVWFAISFYLGGHGVFPLLLNHLVHITMYTYYMMAAFGSSMQKMLNPYKKYLTIVQIVQFVIIIVHMSAPFVNGCDFTRLGLTIVLIYATVLLIMFCNFYKKTYLKKVQ